jgi:hypothetical protein
MTAHREQLERALRAVAVTSPTSYAWFGSPSRPLPRDVTAALARSTVRDYLIERLQRELYRSFYSQGRPVPMSPDRVVPTLPDHAFVEDLSRANTGAGAWESGWHVETVERGTALVARDGLSIRARVSDCRALRGPAAAGDPVSLRRPKELGVGSPGFYTALGDAEPARSSDEVEVRVYFHVTAAGAAPLVAVCTRLLNDAGVPFDLKVVNHPTGFSRCDAAVLYLEDGGFARVHSALGTIASACAPHLRSDPPAFAKPLARGVAVGEHHPSLGASFGAGRCRLLAEGIVAAHERGRVRLEERMDAVARRFAEHGLDVEVPYLAPRSTDCYEL